MRTPEDYMIGEKRNKLTILSEPFKRRYKHKNYVRAICDCGNITELLLYSLKSGKTKSCGCLQKESARNLATHRLTNTRIYRVWISMRVRCDNPNNKGYKWYGERGIRVCKVWHNDFKAFYDWAMRNGYKEGLTIDRFPNKDGNYEPSNCRWVTQGENSRSSNHCKIGYAKAQMLRNLFTIGAFKRKELSFIFHIPYPTINNIVNGDTWA